IAAGANPKSANRDGATPMFLAAMNGSASMIEKLRKAGVDPNVPVLPHGETALMMTSRTGKPEAVQVLLRQAARVDATENLNGTTALMWAAEQGHSAIVRLLLEQGASVNAASKVIEPIKRNGLGFARPGRDGQVSPERLGALTPLIFPARQGSLSTVRILVTAGA